MNDRNKIYDELAAIARKFKGPIPIVLVAQQPPPTHRRSTKPTHRRSTNRELGIPEPDCIIVDYLDVLRPPCA